jgi:predicted phage-related endonuclease
LTTCLLYAILFSSNEGDTPETEEENEMTTTELTTTVRNLKDLMNMKAELDAEIEAAQDIIKAEMTAREVDELKADVLRVTWKTVTSNRFDTTAFKAAHKDIYDLFAKPTTTRRFCIA